MIVVDNNVISGFDEEILKLHPHLAICLKQFIAT